MVGKRALIVAMITGVLLLLVALASTPGVLALLWSPGGPLEAAPAVMATHSVKAEGEHHLNRSPIAALAIPSPVALALAGDRPDGAVRLTTPLAGTSHQNPAFSPGGQTLLFTLFHHGYNAGPAGLYLLPLAGGGPMALLDEEDQDSVNVPGSSWNAATDRITFASDREDTDEVWTIAADGSDLFRVTHHTSPLYFIEPSFSPGGQWIVFEADTKAPEDEQQGSIWRVRADGTGLTQLTDGPGGGTDDRLPNWSPSGDRILFQRRVPGDDDWNLYTMAPDGSHIRQVTTAPSGDTDASWSPDGACIVYSTDHGGLPVPNIFVIWASGGQPVRVTFSDTHEDGAPSWSPNGAWIAFESHEGQAEDSPSALWRIAVSDDLCNQMTSIYLPLVLKEFDHGEAYGVGPHGSPGG